MTIGVIATLKIQDGKNAEFEAFFGDLAKQVRANESGNLAYQLTQSRSDPQTYKVLELYADQDALTHHGGTDYFKAAGPKFGAVLAGRPEVEVLDGKG
jgi:quinol monooxygenase YgiN